MVTNKELIDYLSEFATEQRVALFDKVLDNRTNYLTVVLEDIYQPHNASAVLRTCDCFGLQDVHIIENKNKYQVNPDVALGSSKWLNLKKYNQAEENTVNTINQLKNKGYRIVATTPHTDDVDLPDFDIEKGKTALLFGTEMRGLTETAIAHSDEYLKIPMYGFTESFNISVSAAIILHHLTQKLRNSEIDWEITQSEKEEIKLTWLRNSIKSSEQIIKEFLSGKR